MEKCSICGSDFKTVPAGISKKTGKPYSSFVACSKMGCNGKPTQNTYVPPNMAQNAPNSQNSTDLTQRGQNIASPTPTKEYWEDKGFKMCKHKFLEISFTSRMGMDYDLDAIEKESEEWAERSVRILGKPEVKNGVSDQIPY